VVSLYRNIPEQLRRCVSRCSRFQPCGRKETTELGDTKKLREGNDLAVKIYWPEERRTSEAEILEKAKERGRKTHFIGNHIPEMVCHQHPNFLCSSTKIIRQFLGLPTDSSRRLRVIVFRLLRPIKELKERDMLTAYLQCFFCMYHGRTAPNALLTDSRHRSPPFVEERDPTRGRQPREPDVGRQTEGGHPERFRPRQVRRSGGSERTRQHGDVAVHGPGPVVGGGPTWGDPPSLPA